MVYDYTWAHPIPLSHLPIPLSHLPIPLSHLPIPLSHLVILSDADGRTELVAVHDGLPEGVAPADNEAGWGEALARLAALVESPH